MVGGLFECCPGVNEILRSLTLFAVASGGILGPFADEAIGNSYLVLEKR
jgi:hypothetical protein